jgi:hypothetical protein
MLALQPLFEIVYNELEKLSPHRLLLRQPLLQKIYKPPERKPRIQLTSPL